MNKYSGNYYGTSFSEIKRISHLNKIPLLEVDINGAEQLYSSGVNCLVIGLLTESVDVLRERLENR